MKRKSGPRRAFFIFIFFALFSFNAYPETELDFGGAARMAVEASDELRGEYMTRTLREGVWAWGIRSYLPRLSITASEDDRLSETGADSFLKKYSVNLEQLLWDGGRLSLSRKMERTELDLADSRLKQLASEIAEAGVSGYRAVLQARSVLKIREKTVESLDEQRRILQEEAALGLVR